jgi:hypothetical protein
VVLSGSARGRPVTGFEEDEVGQTSNEGWFRSKNSEPADVGG